MNRRTDQRTGLDPMVAENRSVVIPSEHLKRLILRLGSKIRLHLKGQALATEFKQHGVTDEGSEKLNWSNMS
jgi:hypothetical protein